MDLQSTSVSTPAATLDLYPSEEPEKPELGVWLDRNGAILQRSGHGPIMRDEIPPGLHQLAFQKDMPDIPSLSAEDRAKVGPMDAIKHDLLVAENTRKKLAAEQAYNAGLRECKSKLAAHIELAMRKTAPLRLKALQLKHKDPTTAGIYDGGAMWRDLEAVRHTSSRASTTSARTTATWNRLGIPTSRTAALRIRTWRRSTT